MRPVQLRRPHLCLELLVVLGLVVVYDQIRSHAELRGGEAVAMGRRILDLEHLLSLDVELGLNRWVTSHRTLNHLAASWYQYTHLSVTLAVLTWCYLRRPEIYRWARTSLVLINLIGLTTFFLLPVAPPRLLPGHGFVDGLAQAGMAANELGPVQADQYGAMPSLHVAWAVWVAAVLLAAGSQHRLKLWFCYPVMTTLVVVATGNHYLLDVAAGLLAAECALQHRRVPRRLGGHCRPGRDLRDHRALTSDCAKAGPRTGPASRA